MHHAYDPEHPNIAMYFAGKTTETTAMILPLPSVTDTQSDGRAVKNISSAVSRFTKHAAHALRSVCAFGCAVSSLLPLQASGTRCITTGNVQLGGRRVTAGIRRAPGGRRLGRWERP